MIFFLQVLHTVLTLQCASFILGDIKGLPTSRMNTSINMSICIHTGHVSIAAISNQLKDPCLVQIFTATDCTLDISHIHT